jgi:hypothetical protein
MNFELIENLNVTQDAEDSGPQPSTRPVWSKPTITRIELKRTLLKAGSGGDGLGSSTTPTP